MPSRWVRLMRVLAVALLLGFTAVYVFLNPPADLAQGRGALRACPVTFGSWNGTELSFDDAVQEELDADDILIRRYERDGDVVWLCIVYHQNKRYGAHDPLTCYRSQGYAIEGESTVRIEDGSEAGVVANRFVADRRSDRRFVYYWWATDGLTTADAGEFRRQMAISGALRNSNWGAFVRVEALARGADEAAGWSRLDDFAAEVARSLPAVFDSARAIAGGPS
jgi:EpsI family protein